MRALVAPDKFKGSLSATEVADNLAHGLAATGVHTVTLPLADGGDGSVAAAVAAGMRPHPCTVADALGRPHTATIAVDAETAVVEVANTCGLSTLPCNVLAPMTASSYGFGEAIRHAVGLGVRRIVLALGGSASTDGGAGLLAALGYTFHDSGGQPIRPEAHALNRIRRVDASRAVDLSGVELIVASDVTSPLTGPDGAAALFAPQKGAAVTDVDRLEAGLTGLVSALQRSACPDATALAQLPGAGAAGGCGFAALCLGARIVSGADYFLDLLGFQQRLPDVEVVITGEGCLDRQTLQGKLPAVVAQRAAPTPVIAVAGRTEIDSSSGIFTDIFTVAERTAADTRHDPVLTAELLYHIGVDIGVHLTCRAVKRRAVLATRQ
ncbi:MAG: glycerate kinase [Mycobacterium pseudokansasii]|uniref:Glycerate 2-kinase n=1 Tax=Mycobacterium pseudokansasii TaxID=2341080 RepID=A0A498QZM3_9MYCO|nr:glycerate kinase [Mycobacterium pseudokansasii]KZS67097.1 glycerate kinase [Mycobacterium kansasii]MBY0387287.1 glycerate kinase [Mycobacterium pseudokansasii]VBA32029.1 Glycerate 2-kinase [Mycobacterium pseudokansasii]VBA33774.1 Glycerate 2-kinase [Mycobacterium pseudokansasii]VBA55434.1 Glycerate 2-kinase [Mycobacterium pseudokansasii]